MDNFSSSSCDSRLPSTLVSGYFFIHKGMMPNNYKRFSSDIWIWNCVLQKNSIPRWSIYEQSSDHSLNRMRYRSQMSFDFAHGETHVSQLYTHSCKPSRSQSAGYSLCLISTSVWLIVCSRLQCSGSNRHSYRHLWAKEENFAVNASHDVNFTYRHWFAGSSCFSSNKTIEHLAEYYPMYITFEVRIFRQWPNGRHIIDLLAHSLVDRIVFQDRSWNVIDDIQAAFEKAMKFSKLINN